MASVENIYILTGEEILQEEFIEDLIKKYIPSEAREFNLDFFNGDEISSGSLLQRVTTLPFFSSHRVIIVKYAEKIKKTEQRKLTDILDKIKIPTSTILVFSVTNVEEMNSEFLKKLKDTATVKHFPPFIKKNKAIEERRQWVIRELKKMGVTRIKENALRALVEAPMELRQLRSEIEKLCTYAQGKDITLEDVKAIFTITQDVKIYEFVNAVFERHFSKAIQFLDFLLETGDLFTPLFIIQSLAKQIRLLMEVKILNESGIYLVKEVRKEGRTEIVTVFPAEIPSSSKRLLLEGEDNLRLFLQKRFWLGKSLQTQAYNWSKESLYGMLRLLHKLDIDIKQGADPREKLEWFVLRVSGVFTTKKSTT